MEMESQASVCPFCYSVTISQAIPTPSGFSKRYMFKCMSPFNSSNPRRYLLDSVLNMKFCSTRTWLDGSWSSVAQPHGIILRFSLKQLPVTFCFISFKNIGCGYTQETICVALSLGRDHPYRAGNTKKLSRSSGLFHCNHCHINCSP